MLIITNDTSLELKDDETLLEALERTGHAIESQCRQGYCGSCRTTMISGRVDYPTPPLAYIGQDEILPCCCRTLEPLRLDVYLYHQQTDEASLFDDPKAT